MPYDHKDENIDTKLASDPPELTNKSTPQALSSYVLKNINAKG